MAEYTYLIFSGHTFGVGLKETVISLTISPKVCLDSEAMADLSINHWIQHGYRNLKENELELEG